MKDQSQLTPRWMSLRQAAGYGPYGGKRLVELIREGKIRGCQLADNAKRPWVVDRVSLDEYLEAQMFNDDRQKILAFLESGK